MRQAIARAVAAAGFGSADPGLRPGGGPGRYASSVAFGLGAFERGKSPREIAGQLAAELAEQPWIAAAGATGPASAMRSGSAVRACLVTATAR